SGVFPCSRSGPMGGKKRRTTTISPIEADPTNAPRQIPNLGVNKKRDSFGSRHRSTYRPPVTVFFRRGFSFAVSRPQGFGFFHPHGHGLGLIAKPVADSGPLPSSVCPSPGGSAGVGGGASQADRTGNGLESAGLL